MNVREALHAGRDTAGTRGGRALRNAFVAVQIGAAFVLAVGAGLVGRSLEPTLHADHGYDSRDILTMTIFGYDVPASQRQSYYRQLVERTRALPGVEDAAMSSTVPLSNPDMATVQVEARGARVSESRSIDFAIASPEYFRVMQIPVLTGRGFTEHDTGETPAVALISGSCARALFADENPLGRRLRITDRSQQSWTIVGVTGDVRQHSLDGVPDMAVYVPQAQWGSYWYRLLVQTHGDPWRIYPAVRGLIHELNSREPMFHVQPMDEYVRKTLADRICTLWLTGALTALAILLAAVGVYGVVSYTVAQRTHEVGLRMALGATALEVVALVLKDLARTLLAGLGLGIVIVLALGRLVSHALENVPPADLNTTVVAALVVALVALAAAYVPCRRAIGVDPAAALRLR